MVAPDAFELSAQHIDHASNVWRLSRLDHVLPAPAHSHNQKTSIGSTGGCVVCITKRTKLVNRHCGSASLPNASGHSHSRTQDCPICQYQVTGTFHPMPCAAHPGGLEAAAAAVTREMESRFSLQRLCRLQQG